MKSRVIMALAAAGLVCTPAAIAHSGVSLSGSSISYFSPDPGSVSTAVLKPGPENTIDVSDPTALGGVSPGDCIPTSESSARCPAAGVTKVVASVGPESDSVTSELAIPSILYGGEGADTLTGGSGPDRLDGGNGGDRLDGRSGDDRLMANDGALDRLACGDGSDSVVADPLDVIEDAAACESVARIAPGSPPAPLDHSVDLKPPAISGLRVSPRSFRITPRRRWARVTWRLSEPAAVAFAVERLIRGRYRTVRGGFRLVAGAGRGSAELSLRRRGRPRAPGRYRVRARATDAAGNRSALVRVRFVIRRR
jgi:hypothetical protein